MNLDDTIVAIATPPGRGGIGIVRISGALAPEIASGMVELRGHRATLKPGCAQLGELRERNGERIDEVVVTYFAAPHSYTTDDVVEISCHGSPVLLRRAVEMACAAGARLAEPGEFTQRAFLNGRLDLTQAEAVRDLIDAQTLYQAKIAARQLQGSLSHAVLPSKEKLLELIARLEAGIDFAEDDIDVMPSAAIIEAIEPVAAELRALEHSFTFGRLVHDGLTLAIVGRPNVGKSSLFNRLIERERAIVTAQPGTTRDLVTETVSFEGIPVRLVDTAGLREALDEAEHIGIGKSLEAIADADLVLVVLDASQPAHPADGELLASLADRSAIVVCNKTDLAAAVDSSPAQAVFSGASDDPGCPIQPVPFSLSGDSPLPIIRCSALTGLGIAELRAQILRSVRGSSALDGGAMLTNLRQHEQVKAALAALAAATVSVGNAVPHEMLLLDLYSALRSLDEMTGATTADDILNRIFSSFCIGK